MSVYTPPEFDKNDIQKYWKHRRTHSYISLAWILISTVIWALMAIFYPDTIPLLSGVIGWSYAAPFGVVSWYFGNTLAEEIMRRKKEW